MGNFITGNIVHKTFIKSDFINPIQFDTKYGESILYFNPMGPLKEYYLHHAKTNIDESNMQLNIDQYNDISLFIKNKLYDKDFCTDIGRGYISDAMTTSTGIFVLKQNTKLFGFVIFTINEDDINDTYLYIEVICSNKKYKGYGIYLMHIVEYLCQIYGIHKIKLDSIDTAISFYLKLGYNPVESLIEFEKIITPRNDAFVPNIKRNSRFSPSASSSFFSAKTYHSIKKRTPSSLSIVKSKSKSKTKRKRCKNGTRKNPKTLLCEKTITPHHIRHSIQSNI